MERVKRKKEEIKEKTIETEVSTQRPNIDATSQKIVEGKLAEKRGGKSTYERLYELNKEWKDKKLQKLEVEQNKYKVDQPHNLSVREKPLDQTLYEDAERRRKENAFKKAELDKTRDMPKEKQYKNENSDKYVKQRFEKEIQ